MAEVFGISYLECLPQLPRKKYSILNTLRILGYCSMGTKDLERIANNYEKCKKVTRVDLDLQFCSEISDARQNGISPCTYVEIIHRYFPQFHIFPISDDDDDDKQENSDEYS
jgi:hypothetical protein